MFTLFATVFVLIVQHTSATVYRCSCQCPHGSSPGFAYTTENSTEACVTACIASPFNPCVASNTYACLGTDCAYSSSYDNSTTTTMAPHYRCFCQCPHGSSPGFAYTTENTTEACVRACIASPFNPCVASNTYACLGTDCAYSSSYDNSTTTAVAPWYRCSCECPYGSSRGFAYTMKNSSEACVRACIASPFNPCVASNTYACLGTDCAYSSSYDNSTETIMAPRYRCSCQCPYGYSQGFAYTSENSSQACVRACIAVPFNPCIPWNTYACLGTNCVYSSWYFHSRRAMSPNYTCSCQCPEGSNRTSVFTTDDSPETCATACNSTLEINTAEGKSETLPHSFVFRFCKEMMYGYRNEHC